MQPSGGDKVGGETVGEDNEAGQAGAGSPKSKDVVDVLRKMFEDGKDERFEWLAKQYYDLFAYHAAQRLTAFNFFIVSLSFFSNAYATFITRSQGDQLYYNPALGLALVAWLLTIFFARLDKRNEQIIQINEEPLKKLQQAVASHFESKGTALDQDGHACANVFRTFREADKSYRFRTFGSLLPSIFTIAAAACVCGAAYAAFKAMWLSPCCIILISIALVVFSLFAIHSPMSCKKKVSD